MTALLRKTHFLEWTLVGLALFALAFPYYSSKAINSYAPDIILVNCFVVLFLAGAFFGRGLDIKRREPLGWALLVLIVVLTALLLYANVTNLHWYYGQVNMTLPFLLFVALLFLRNDAMPKQDGVIRFLLFAVIVTNLVGLVFYARGYATVRLLRHRVRLMGQNPALNQGTFFTWVYLHKSQYGLMLNLFLGLLVSHRQCFKSKWVFILGVVVLLVGLAISYSYTSMGGAVLILLCMVADRLRKRIKAIPRRRLILLALVVLLIIVCGVYLIGQKRDLASLGSRLQIWRASIEYLWHHPQGLGRETGRMLLIPTDASKNNCHNLFLNWMYQYSIPAGLCMTAMFGLIVLAALRRNRNFTAWGIWGALLAQMTMDWCLLPNEMPMLMLCIYLIFFTSGGQTGLKTLQESGFSPTCD